MPRAGVPHAAVAPCRRMEREREGGGAAACLYSGWGKNKRKDRVFGKGVIIYVFVTVLFGLAGWA